MEFKELLTKLSFPCRQIRKKEEKEIADEENLIKDSIAKVCCH